MQIGRFIKSSLSEWKGKNSCVIEVRGSILRSPCLCPPELFESEGPTIGEDEIISFLSDDSNNTEAVVLSGGEPLLQKDLYPFLKELKKLRLPILLRTEGVYPDALDDLTGACMFDRVCVKLCDEPAALGPEGERILRSLKILAESDMEYMVEIVSIPGRTDGALVESICRPLRGRCTVVISEYKQEPASTNPVKSKGFTKKEVLALVAAAKKHVKKVEVKGF